MILDLHHAQITIPPGSEPAARAFYCDLLGFQEIEKPAALQPRGGLWLQVGDREVHLGIETGNLLSRSRAHLAYLVRDLPALRDRLDAAGYPTSSQLPIPGYRRCELRDPFGNRLELIERT